jgi:predicted DNA binding CopG/RHH family protein
MNKIKKIPFFKNEDEARKFWASHSLTDYFDVSKAIVNPVFPSLKPSTKTISIRLPEQLINSLKMIANSKDVPYQSLVKMFLSEKVKQELAT